jgi:hypothetical protein
VTEPQSIAPWPGRYHVKVALRADADREAAWMVARLLDDLAAVRLGMSDAEIVRIGREVGRLISGTEVEAPATP